MPYLTLTITQLTKFPLKNVSTASSSHLTETYSNIFSSVAVIYSAMLKRALTSAPAAKK